MKLIYDASPNDVLLENGTEISGGTEFEVSDERAAQLIADPYVPVREPAGDLRAFSRGELNELAAKAGVDNPVALRNRDAVIAALQETEAAASAQTQPAADDGEGQTQGQEA